jgi:hypothetical protein
MKKVLVVDVIEKMGDEVKECGDGDSFVIQEGFRKYGLPLGLYSERHTIFRCPNE